jgi:hypothetical protein
MRKIITYLYNKFCKENVETAYIAGIQRDFTFQPDVSQDKIMATVAKEAIESKLLELVVNNELKKYVEILLVKGESQEMRDFAIYAINIILKFEEEFKVIASKVEEKTKQFDEYNPL